MIIFFLSFFHVQYQGRLISSDCAIFSCHSSDLDLAYQVPVVYVVLLVVSHHSIPLTDRIDIYISKSFRFSQISTTDSGSACFIEVSPYNFCFIQIQSQILIHETIIPLLDKILEINVETLGNIMNHQCVRRWTLDIPCNSVHNKNREEG